MSRQDIQALIGNDKGLLEDAQLTLTIQSVQTGINITDIQNKINNLPHNLNNHTLVVTFSVNAWEAVEQFNAYKNTTNSIAGEILTTAINHQNQNSQIGLYYEEDELEDITKITTDIPSASTHYTKLLALTPLDYENQILSRTNTSKRKKLLPFDIQVRNLLNKDIVSWNISFESFYGGKLIVWGNNKWFINNITVQLTDQEALIYTSHRETENINYRYTITQLLTFLEKTFISVDCPDDNLKLYSIKSMGINKYRSTLSFVNTYANTYVYNLKIQNNLVDDPNTLIETPDSLSNLYKLHIHNNEICINTFDFPEQSSIIGYWPLSTNGEIQIKNTQYLSPIKSYTLLSKNVKYLSHSDTDTGINKNILNTTINTNQNKTQTGLLYPGYLYWDTLTADGNMLQKSQSNDIKSILYNKNGLTPNTTVAIWAYKAGTDMGNNPIISDYNYNTLSGIIIGPDSIKYRNPINTIDSWSTIGGSQFDSIAAQLHDNWILYLYEFQHHDAMVPDWTNLLSYYSSQQLNKAFINPPQQGYMRINIHAIYKNKDNNTVHRLLYPTDSNLYDEYSKLLLNTIVNNTENTIETDTVSGTFPIPEIQPTTNLYIGGIKVENALSVQPTAGYSLWNGGFRNLIIFNRFLSHNQMCNLYNSTILTSYKWNLDNEFNSIIALTTKPYFGSIYTNNTNNITVQGCLLKQNIKYIQTDKFNTQISTGQFYIDNNIFIADNNVIKGTQNN